MSSTTLAANMKATAEAMVMSFNGKWDTEESLAPRAPECIHEMLPKSIGLPAKTNDEWAARFERVKHLILDAKMTIDDYLFVPDERRAVVRSTMVADTPAGEFRNEYIWFFTFDETGEKIVRITEFMDTQAVADFRTKMRESGHGEDH